MSLLRRAVPVLLIALVAAVALLGAGPASAASRLTAATPPDGSPGRWSLTQGGGPLSAVDRNDYDEQSGTPKEVPGTGGSGRALQFSVPGGGQRSEVRPQVPRAVEGTTQDVTYKARLAENFPADADGWQIILQWHQSSDSGSPPVAVEINKGRLMLDNGETHQTEIGRVSAGDTLDLRLRVHFSRDADDSSIDVWNGGRQVLTGFKPAEGTLQKDGRNYMKVGLYRSEDISEDAQLTLDDLEVTTGPTTEEPGPSGLGIAPVVSAIVLLVVGGAVVVVLVRRGRRRDRVR
jgi:hypothetical protein